MEDIMKEVNIYSVDERTDNCREELI